MATIQKRIESLIGTSYTDSLAIDSGEIKELYVNAIATVTDLLPADMALRYCQQAVLGTTGYLKLTNVTATKANLGVFTNYEDGAVASHGFEVGDTVQLSSFTEMTELNGMTTQVAAVPSDTTFTLEGIDSSNYGAVETTDHGDNLGGTVERTASATGNENLAYEDDGYKILGVSWGGSSGNTYSCHKVDIAEASRVSNNSDSIYALNDSTNILTPVYYIEPSFVDSTSATNSIVKVIPTPNNSNRAIVYYQQYVGPDDVNLALDTFVGKTGDPTTETGDNPSAVELGNNMPKRAYQAVIIKTAELIVNHLVGQAVTEEEDPELLGLYQGQLQTLKGLFAEEITLLTGGQPKGSAGG